MNSKLLLQKRINLNREYIDFLNFLHPDFEIVGSHPIMNVASSLDEYDNPMPRGIIYNGQYESDTLEKLNKITPNWIVVNAHHFDIDLSTNENLIKYLLPIHYAQLKNSKSNELSVYNDKHMGYDNLLELIKQCLISNTKLSAVDCTAGHSVYTLYAAILGTPDVLNYEFFNLVNRDNVSAITSSILTFLNKVQCQKVKNEPVYYARLISQSNKRYGKRIQQAVLRFVKSKANKEVALYNLLTDLNRSR